MKPEATRVSVEIGDAELTLETGKYAKQASGSVVIQAGDTMVLGTATAGNERDVDFLPLTVDVEERMYAAGKIPGSFFRREGRAGEKATLTARMIDRPLRPLFPKGWHRETQLVAIPLSIDHENPYDILAMNAASAALTVSDIPFPQPVGAVRIGLSADGDILVNPDEETLQSSSLDLVVAGTEEAILMVEAGAKEIPEAEVLDALDIAHGEIRKLCQAQRELGVEQRILRRVDHEVAVLVFADPHRAHGRRERDVGDHERGARAVHGEDVVRVDVVDRQRDRHELRLAPPALGEERTQRAVDHACGERALLTRAALAAEERAGDLARGVHSLLDVDGEREEVDVA